MLEDGKLNYNCFYINATATVLSSWRTTMSRQIEINIHTSNVADANVGNDHKTKRVAIYVDLRFVDQK